MTKREILTQLVSAYIQGSGGKFPKLTEEGLLADAWYKTVDVILRVEEDNSYEY